MAMLHHVLRPFIYVASQASDLEVDDRRIDKVAFALIAFVIMFLLLFGWKYHPIEAVWYEADAYVEKAEKIQNGQIPGDRFRPLLYPITSALSGFILNDTFTGARTVSTLMAGILLIGVYLLGKTVFDRKTAFICLLLTITNHYVLVFGVVTTTDMMFFAFSVWVLLLSVKIVQCGNGKLVPYLGLAFALAYFTRYQAILLLPTVFLTLYLSSEGSMKTFSGRAFGFVISALIFLAPHFFLMSWKYGTLIYDENWKNIALKMHGEMDRDYFISLSKADAPYNGLLSVIMSDPVYFLKLGVKELISFMGTGINSLLQVSPVLGGLFFLGAYLSLFSLSKIKFILLFTIAVYIVAISFTFWTIPRMMLPVLPLCYLVIADFLTSMDYKVSIRDHKIQVFVVAALILCFVNAVSSVDGMVSFIKRHPIKEIEAALSIQEQYGDDITVIGNIKHVKRHSDYKYFMLSLHAKDNWDQKTKHERLLNRLQDKGADYLLIGRVVPVPDIVEEDLLLNRGVPSFLRLLRLDEDVAIYRVCIENENIDSQPDCREESNVDVNVLPAK